MLTTTYILNCVCYSVYTRVHVAILQCLLLATYAKMTDIYWEMNNLLIEICQSSVFAVYANHMNNDVSKQYNWL